MFLYFYTLVFHTYVFLFFRLSFLSSFVFDAKIQRVMVFSQNCGENTKIYLYIKESIVPGE